MKAFLILLFIPIITLGKWSENETEATYLISQADEYNEFNAGLGLPINWGNPFGGPAHSHKFFQDESKSLILYCKTNNFCQIQIQKSSQSSEALIFDDIQVTTVTLYSLKDSFKLFNALKVKPIVHANYELKVLTNKSLSFSISCLKSQINASEVACQIQIFKDKPQQELQ